MSRPPQFFEPIILLGGPLDGAHVLIGRGHHVIQVHTQTPYDDSKSDQPVETHRYHYRRTTDVTHSSGFDMTIFQYATNLKTISE